ncbi:MAG TPA: glycosyltransferase family 4 protein [Stellaceae bacterium]
MRIAQVAPLMEAVPPKLYGGSERIVAFLCQELTALGHEVTLFASGDSMVEARLAPVWPQALRLDPSISDYLAPHMIMLEALARQAEEFDVVHSHVDYLAYPLLQRLGVPHVTTLHGRLDIAVLQRIYECFDDVPVVSISDAQRRPVPQANYVATIQHGVPERLLLPGFGSGGYLAFLGRISPEKAPDAAIRIAQRAGMPIRLAAKVDKVDRRYFEKAVEPMLGFPGVEFVGEIGDDQKAEFLGNAAALLFPIAWREPFGLAMIEAMACGTPVIAFRRASVPEIIDDGITGFVVDTEEQAAEAVSQAARLDRSRVRRVFEERFTGRRMAEDYLNVYRRLMAREQPLRQAV